MRDAIIIDFLSREAGIISESGWFTSITPEQLKELIKELPESKVTLI